ncbi:MAG: TIM barrel protein [Actinomycetota bacterium]|nr:TIM barrel protein [Actinomycetota bacterium]
MTRPITLLTGQWTDLPFEKVAELAGGWGYEGLEIACWSDQLDPWRWDDEEYVAGKKAVLEKNGLGVWAVSNHLKGQAVCDDPIDQRHRDILSHRVWDDGEPEGVRRRAAEELKSTARLTAKLGVKTVTGFTGSSIWKYVATFPPASKQMVDAGYEDFANRLNPILDVFHEVGVRFAHEVHPSEIAYDYWTAVRTVEAISHREAFGLNWDPSHMVWQDLDPVSSLCDFRHRIYNVHVKDTKRRMSNRAMGLGSHPAWGRSASRLGLHLDRTGDVPWENAFRMLKAIDYRGPLSAEWEDAGMDRVTGARGSRVREAPRLRPTGAAFDAALNTK